MICADQTMNTIKFTKICDHRGRTLLDATFRPGRCHDQTALQTDGIDNLLDQFPTCAARWTPAALSPRMRRAIWLEEHAAVLGAQVVDGADELAGGLVRFKARLRAAHAGAYPSGVDGHDDDIPVCD
jgi:hypothetical protein